MTKATAFNLAFMLCCFFIPIAHFQLDWPAAITHGFAFALGGIWMLMLDAMEPKESK